MKDGRRLRVVVCDDHSILVGGLVAVLAAAGIEVVAIADTIQQACDVLQRLQPDVLLLDVDLPDGHGVDAMPELRAACPRAAVVILTSLADPTLLRRALAAGCSGVVGKHEASESIVRAVRRAGDGEVLVDRAVLTSMLRGEDERPTKASPALTGRDVEILELLATGASNKAIAEQLHISPHTVRNRLSEIFRRLGVASRLEAVMVAARHGLIRLDAPAG